MPHAAGGARRPLRALRRRAAIRRGAAPPPLAPPPGPHRCGAGAGRMRTRSGRAAGGCAVGAWPPGAARRRAASARARGGRAPRRSACSAATGARQAARGLPRAERGTGGRAGGQMRASCLGGQPPSVTSVLGSYDITPRPSVRCRPRNACARGARSARVRLLCVRAPGAAGAPRTTLPGAAPAACRWRGGRVRAAPAPAAPLRAHAWKGRRQACRHAPAQRRAGRAPLDQAPCNCGRERISDIHPRDQQDLHVCGLPPPPLPRPCSPRTGRARRAAHQVEPDAGGRGEHDGARDHADEAHAQARHRQDHEDDALCAARARARLATGTLTYPIAARRAAGRRRAKFLCAARWRCAVCRQRSGAEAARHALRGRRSVHAGGGAHEGPSGHTARGPRRGAHQQTPLPARSGSSPARERARRQRAPQAAAARPPAAHPALAPPSALSAPARTAGTPRGRSPAAHPARRARRPRQR